AACATGVPCISGACYTAPPGSVTFDVPGTATFVVPFGVTSVSVVVVGGGGGTTTSGNGQGAGGGGLCYLNAIPVTPVASSPVVVGAGGLVGPGGQSSFDTTLVAF